MRARLFAIMMVLAFAGCAAEESGDAPDAPSAEATSAALTPDAVPGRASSAPGAPIRVSIEIEDARALFAGGARVRVAVTGASIEHARAGLALPDGVERVSGEIAFEGPLDGTSEIDAVVRAAPGAYVLRAWAEAPMPPGSRAAPSALLQVEGDAASARANAAPQPAPAFRVTLTGDAASVRATVEADDAAPARVALVVPDVFPTSRGPHEREVELSPGAPYAMTLSLGEAERWSEGYTTVTVHVAPDAAVDGRLYSDALYFWWEGEALRASETPP